MAKKDEVKKDSTKKVEEEKIEKKETKKKEVNKIQEKIKKVRALDREEYVPVMNNTTNNLFFKHSNCLTTLDMYEYGDIQEIKIGELMTMKSSQPRILKECWLMILDEDVVEAMGFSEMYENVITVDKADELFKLSAKKIKDVLSKAPKIVKENIGRLVKKRVDNGKWESLTKLKAIEEALNIKFDEI